MVAALTQSRDTSRKEDGYVRFELLEQVGRSGHVAVVEVWKDQKAFDYDQRPYKTLTVAPATAAGNGQAIDVVAHVDTNTAAGPVAVARRAS